MKIVVVIPTYNEAENIIRLLKDIFSQKIPGLEAVVVDDNSPDATAEKAEQAKKLFSGIHILKRPGKFGYGSSVIVGFKKALAIGADLIISMDADFSHSPDDLPRLISAITEENADVVIGSRKIPGGKIEGWGWFRLFISETAQTLSRAILGLKPKDVTAGFRIYKRRVLESINMDEIKSNGYAFLEEFLFKIQEKGFKIKEIPVIFKERTQGRSKLKIRDIKEFLYFLLPFRFKK
jgi:dolichol-phosphate mannosyltransferase